MRSSRALLGWIVTAALGAGLLIWAYPKAFPYAPRHWRITRSQAEAIALERLTDLGPPVKSPYVVTRLGSDSILERRLQVAAGRRAPRELAENVLSWEVFVYKPEVQRDDWTYSAQVGLAGEVLTLRLRLDPLAPGRAISPALARAQADAFLVREGIDLALYGQPELRSQQLARRTDLAVRYPDRRPTPGRGATHGLEVTFAGDRLAGFEPWFDDPGQHALERAVQAAAFAEFGRLLVVYLLILVLCVPFLKRYHEGEIGVRRGVQIFLLVLAAGLVLALLTARANAQGTGFGFATREQLTYLVVIFLAFFGIIPQAVLAFLAWSVGESICRERWGQKLAAFDALFQGEWGNATVARAAVRGVAAGLAIAGGTAALLLALQRAGAWALASNLVSSSSAWPGLQIVASLLITALSSFLVIALYLVPVSVRRLGRTLGGLAATAPAALVLFRPFVPLPYTWGAVLAVLFAGAFVALFLRYDLLTVLLAGAVSMLLLTAYPLFAAADPRLTAHAWLAFLVVLSPLLASLRHLTGRKEFVYRYEDVPPHVRRIADRERQRVELETARGIQSSILPDLPPRLNGVDLAHAYLPASEVGGDFYDVLALADGRLAVAVGDVAGHGVSSGLVMSMAKSALAVQVTFNPEVAAVFATLNRMVFQTARKRLLTTLCYAVLDPRERELVYASAGHLFPYVVSSRGGVHALESVAYPLGVRRELEIEARRARLAAGDTLFLCSDGIVEARPEEGEEFGFRRLEESLARHSGESVDGLRDGVLDDLQRFTGHVPREDDQTILVLRLAET